MGIRHLARQRALQWLYAMEFAAPDEPAEEVERRFLRTDRMHRRGWGPFARALARQTRERQAELDAAIGPMLHNWRIERLPLVERICLRLALCEMACFPDVPLRVTLNEYIELARQFGDEEAPVYINAVLDTLSKAYAHKDFQAKGAAEPRAPRVEPDASLAARPSPEEETDA